VEATSSSTLKWEEEEKGEKDHMENVAASANRKERGLDSIDSSKMGGSQGTHKTFGRTLP